MPNPRAPQKSQLVESFTDLRFALAGIDVSSAFSEQLPRPMANGQYAQTTVLGVNVRTFEPAQNRARGGSRPGISQYIGSQVNGVNKIQMINTVVTVSGTALSANLPVDGFPWTYTQYLGPAGNYVPFGGSGVQPNRNIATPSSGAQPPPPPVQNGYAGTITGPDGGNPGNYLVALIGGTSITMKPVGGVSGNIPSGTGVVGFLDGTNIYFQPTVWH